MGHNAEYNKINDILTSIENHKYAIFSIDWCSNRIDWAWKWRKINQKEMEELADRVVAVYKEMENK